VGSAVKAHMFKEVSQTLLVVFLLDRTYPLRDKEVGTAFRHRILSNVVSQPVIEMTNSHCRIVGYLICRIYANAAYD
jgi:hypothetical protein